MAEIEQAPIFKKSRDKALAAFNGFQVFTASIGLLPEQFIITSNVADLDHQFIELGYFYYGQAYQVGLRIMGLPPDCEYDELADTLARLILDSGADTVPNNIYKYEVDEGAISSVTVQVQLQFNIFSEQATYEE